jgi:hypothetical protein
MTVYLLLNTRHLKQQIYIKKINCKKRSMMNYTKHCYTVLLMNNTQENSKGFTQTKTQATQLPQIMVSRPSRRSRPISTFHQYDFKCHHHKKPSSYWLNASYGEPEAQTRLKRHTSFRVVICACQSRFILYLFNFTIIL